MNMEYEHNHVLRAAVNGNGRRGVPREIWCGEDRDIHLPA